MLRSVSNKGNLDHSKIFRTAYFRFYEELNDFLPAKHFKKLFAYNFTGNPSIKDTIEAMGVPHVEVDLILVDGRSVDFNYKLKGTECISVYPVFESFDISDVTNLRPEPLRKIKFIADVNLGKLAQKLRLLGFDTCFGNDYQDREIIELSLKEKRTILTRDIGILKHMIVTHGYWIRDDDPYQQIKEVVNRFHLQNNFKPFSRCSLCNGKLKKANKKLLSEKLKRNTLENFHEFAECEKCGKIYWKGSHYKMIVNWIEELRLES